MPNNTPLHEAAETTRSIVEVFRSNPLALALVLMNCALLGFLYYGGVTANQQRSRELELLYQNRRETADLLARCTLAPPQK